jgi:hypothetical protein
MLVAVTAELLLVITSPPWSGAALTLWVLVKTVRVEGPSGGGPPAHAASEAASRADSGTVALMSVRGVDGENEARRGSA